MEIGKKLRDVVDILVSRNSSEVLWLKGLRYPWVGLEYCFKLKVGEWMGGIVWPSIRTQNAYLIHWGLQWAWKEMRSLFVSITFIYIWGFLAAFFDFSPLKSNLVSIPGASIMTEVKWLTSDILVALVQSPDLGSRGNFPSRLIWALLSSYGFFLRLFAWVFLFGFFICLVGFFGGRGWKAWFFSFPLFVWWCLSCPPK